MSAANAAAAAVIVYLLVAIALFVGWVLNVVAIFSLLGGDITAELVIRIVGVFAFPLGGIVGYF